MFGVSVSGQKEIQRNLREFQRKLAKGVEEGLIDGAGILHNRSQEIVPVLTQALHDESGTEAQPKNGLETVVFVFYGPPGGKSEDYAVVQHENIDEFNHAPGKQAKYLEAPTRDTSVQKAIVRAIAEKTELNVRNISISYEG